MLSACGVDAQITPCTLGGAPFLCFEADPLTPAQAAFVHGHSALYMTAALEGDLLRPLDPPAIPCLPGDMPDILKYKGKTNAAFTHLLINLALSAGGVWQQPHPRVLDPICGRGTTLFVALNRGWDATGSDIDRAALREAEQFFKRYLEYHRFKHATRRGSLTLRGKKSAPYTAFTLPAGTLRLAEAEAARAREAFGAGTFDLLCADLPYGVQHGANMPLETLLRLALPAWVETLMALSFNAQTLPARKVRALLAGAGLRVLEGGPYDHFEHWVEQAVTRDIAVAVRP